MYMIHLCKLARVKIYTVKYPIEFKKNYSDNHHTQ